MRQMLRIAVTLMFVAILSLPNALLAQEATPTATHRGVQRANMDLSVDPGEDFYRYATGGWQDRTRSHPTRRLGRLRSGRRPDPQPAHRLCSTATPSPDSCRSAPTSGRRCSSSRRPRTGDPQRAGHRADRRPIWQRIDAITTLDELYAFLRDAPLTTNVARGLSCI